VATSRPAPSGRYARTPGHRASTPTTSERGAARRRVRIPPPPPCCCAACAGQSGCRLVSEGAGGPDAHPLLTRSVRSRAPSWLTRPRGRCGSRSARAAACARAPPGPRAPARRGPVPVRSTPPHHQGPSLEDRAGRRAAGRIAPGGLFCQGTQNENAISHSGRTIRRIKSPSCAPTRPAVAPCPHEAPATWPNTDRPGA
jgi:hypothetical protein